MRPHLVWPEARAKCEDIVVHRLRIRSQRSINTPIMDWDPDSAYGADLAPKPNLEPQSDYCHVVPSVVPNYRIEPM